MLASTRASVHRQHLADPDSVLKTMLAIAGMEARVG